MTSITTLELFSALVSGASPMSSLIVRANDLAKGSSSSISAHASSTTVSKKIGDSWGTLATWGMPTSTSARGERFHAYVERLSSALGHQDRHGPLRDYVTGLCLPGDRKSIEPMAARVDPRHVRARHQSMHHFVANAAWDDAAVLRIARETVLAALERHGPVAAWVVDDTGMPKKGRHSVGVARQYC